MRYAAIVYQAGIANVFKTRYTTPPLKRKAQRLLQGSFAECEAFIRGLSAAGVGVYCAMCNEAGDITDREWMYDITNAPFRGNMHPPAETAFAMWSKRILTRPRSIAKRMG